MTIADNAAQRIMEFHGVPILSAENPRATKRYKERYK
jgi:hypothetical protein